MQRISRQGLNTADSRSLLNRARCSEQWDPLLKMTKRESLMHVVAAILLKSNIDLLYCGIADSGMTTFKVAKYYTMTGYIDIRGPQTREHGRGLCRGVHTVFKDALRRRVSYSRWSMTLVA